MADFPALKAAREALRAKQSELKVIFDAAGPDLDMTKAGFATSEDGVATVQAKNVEAGVLADKIKGYEVLQAGVEHAQAYGDVGAEESDRKSGAKKTFGELYAARPEMKQRGSSVEMQADVKTLMSRSAGWAPESLREGGYQPAAVAPLSVIDKMPTLTTKYAAVKYMEQTTRTNNAAERAEGAAYAESAFAFTEQSVTIETIGVFLPVTDEQLEDEEEAAAMIDLEMPTMLRQRLDGQLLNGNGATPNIRGVNQKAGINVQAKGADTALDALYKGFDKVATIGRSTVTGFFMNPTDWQPIRLLRTVDGLYIMGNPDQAITPRVWGVEGVLTTLQPVTTVIAGDFAGHSRLYVKRDIKVERTNSNGTDFQSGVQAIRAGVRVAAVWRRATAFTSITGL